MTLEEILRSKEFKEGWDVYEYNRLHSEWPTGCRNGECPYPNKSNGYGAIGTLANIVTDGDRWLAGANSAYGRQVWRGIPARTEPITTRRQKQLTLF